MKPYSRNLLTLSILLCMWLVHGQQGTNSGSIVVEDTGSALSTRVGCYQELRCSGVGTRISWRLFGVRRDLVNSTTYFVLTESEPIDGHPSGVFQWRSIIVFPSITAGDANAYSCSVFYQADDVNLIPLIITVQLEVAREAISIEPPIRDKSISSYYVGDSLLIGCPVQTCASGVTVEFYLNDTVVATGMPSSTDERVYTTNLPVIMDTPGTYACRVTGDAPDAVALQFFNITGTPMIRPTLSTTTGQSDETPGETVEVPVNTDFTGDPTQTTTTGHGVQLVPSLPLSYLFVLGAWLCASYRL